MYCSVPGKRSCMGTFKNINRDVGLLLQMYIDPLKCGTWVLILGVGACPGHCMLYKFKNTIF